MDAAGYVLARGIPHIRNNNNHTLVTDTPEPQQQMKFRVQKLVHGEDGSVRPGHPHVRVARLFVKEASPSVQGERRRKTGMRGGRDILRAH